MMPVRINCKKELVFSELSVVALSPARLYTRQRQLGLIVSIQTSKAFVYSSIIYQLLRVI
jgi:hypothetical protein